MALPFVHKHTLHCSQCWQHLRSLTLAGCVQCQRGVFLYFDDESEDKATAHSNTRHFLSLWLAMRDSKLIALCSLQSTPRSAPRPVALVPITSQLLASGVQVRRRSPPEITRIYPRQSVPLPLEDMASLHSLLCSS